LRPTPLPSPRLTVLLLGLACCGAGLPRVPASCPQYEFAHELPPVSDEPHLVLNADHVELEQSGVSRLSGSVTISQGGREFSAPQLEYRDADRRLHIDSRSLFRDSELVVESQSADFDLNRQTGVFNETRYTLIPLTARGAAQRIAVERAGRAQLDEVSYTTCAPSSEAWILRADRIELDRNTGMGVSRNSTLWFQGVPILYLPYFRFPLDDQRHTGFLFPTVGELHNTGFDVREPFYLNLAPNYDDTLIPRYMSRRGFQIGNRFRYLTEDAEGSLYSEYLNHDEETGFQRSYVDFEHHGLLTPRLGLQAEYGAVSDRAYFEDLGGNIDLAATSFLPQGAKLTYQAPTAYTVSALVEGYQPINSALQSTENPYQRLPQIRIDAVTKNRYLDTRAGLSGEFTNFVRSDAIEGQRIVAQPYLRWEQDHAAWFAAGQIDLSYTAYNLTDAGGLARRPQRSLPLYSLEGGLHFERITAAGRLQTLEPHLFYLYVPYHNQDALPLFDSGEPDFDFPDLFARNRYTGEDRISDAHQLTSALTTRLIDPASGLVRLSASFGEIYRLRAPRVDLPGFNMPSAGSSDFITRFDYQFNAAWDAAAEAEWTPQFDRIVRDAVALRYRQPDGGLAPRQFDLAYRYRDGLLEQTDLSFATPVSSHWRLASRLRYSLRDSRALESFAGIEYQTCCWAIRTTWHRYLSNSRGDFNNGVYFQLELKGLSRLGTGFQQLLPAADPFAPIQGRRGNSLSSMLP